MQENTYLKKIALFFKVLKDFNKNNLFYRKITIPECYTVNQVLDLIEKNQYISGGITINPVEGSIFPDTYYFLRNVNADNLLKRMQSKMTEKLDKIWIGNHKYFKSENDLLIMASLIEAEAKEKEEKYLVSSVFHNRLKKKYEATVGPYYFIRKKL